MCTVTWLIQDESYLLLFNRDERRDRAPELAPRIHLQPARYIAPLDGAAGGSWMTCRAPCVLRYLKANCVLVERAPTTVN